MVSKLVKERYEKEGKQQCQECGIYSKNGRLCRKCFDEKYPELEENYRIDYYKMNVKQYSRKHNMPVTSSAMELNRMMSDTWDDFALEYVTKEKQSIQKKWFLFGYVVGSVSVASLMQIF